MLPPRTGLIIVSTCLQNVSANLGPIVGLPILCLSIVDDLGHSPVLTTLLTLLVGELPAGI